MGVRWARSVAIVACLSMAAGCGSAVPSQNPGPSSAGAPSFDAAPSVAGAGSSARTGTPLRWPYEVSRAGDPTARANMRTDVSLAPGAYRAILIANTPPVWPATPPPEFACQVTGRLAFKATWRQAIWELTVSHDPATDPGAQPSASHDFRVDAYAEFYVSFAWGCPFTFQIDKKP
jgi:hypothetical protein